MKTLFRSISASGNPTKFIYEVGDPNAEVMTLENLDLDMTNPDDFLFAHSNKDILTGEEVIGGVRQQTFSADIYEMAKKIATEMDEKDPQKKQNALNNNGGAGYLNSIETWSIDKDPWTKSGDLDIELCKKIADKYTDKFISVRSAQVVDRENLGEENRNKRKFISIIAKHIQSQFKERLFKRDAYNDREGVGKKWKADAIIEGIQEGVKDAIIFEGYTVTPHLSEEQIKELKKRKEEKEKGKAEKTKQFHNELSEIVEKTLPGTQTIINKVA